MNEIADVNITAAEAAAASSNTFNMSWLMRHAVLQILGVNSSPYFCVKVWVSISNLVLLFDRVAFRPTDQEEEEEDPTTATIVVDVVVMVVAAA